MTGAESGGTSGVRGPEWSWQQEGAGPSVKLRESFGPGSWGGRVLLSLLLGVHPTLAQPLHCAKE